MKLDEIKNLNKQQTILVDMGYKFKSSKVKAYFIETEVVPSFKGEEELCVVKPFEVVEDKCGFASWSININTLIEPRQILKVIE